MNKTNTTTKGKNRQRLKKIIRNGNKIVFSKALREELINFMEFHCSRRFSNNLRTLLMDFLMSEGATEANYLQDLLYDLQGLFSLIDVIEKDRETNT